MGKLERVFGGGMSILTQAKKYCNYQLSQFSNQGFHWQHGRRKQLTCYPGNPSRPLVPNGPVGPDFPMMPVAPV